MISIKFRGTESYRKHLQEEALKRGMKVQTLIEAALDAYLNGAELPTVGPAVEPQSSDSLALIDILVELAKLTRRVEEYAAELKMRGQK